MSLLTNCLLNSGAGGKEAKLGGGIELSLAKLCRSPSWIPGVGAGLGLNRGDSLLNEGVSIWVKDNVLSSSNTPSLVGANIGPGNTCER